MILIGSPQFARHANPPGHPERAERAHVFDATANGWLMRGGGVLPPRPATEDEVLCVHTSEHVARVGSSAGKALMFDADTFTSPDSYSIALLSAGATIQAAEHALVEQEVAFALVRPPGHHAESNRAMGFCLFNNAAVAAAAMLARGLERLAIVDIDVHHGNGTQEIFYGDPRVLYVSTHQYPFYPGTGAASDVGQGDGRGYTVNVPMDAGSTDADFAVVHRDIINPLLEEFRPELVLVSAGFDAHERDPLASMRMTVNGYAAVLGSLRDVALRHGGLALVTEGGYELSALAACLEASVAVLDGGTVPVIEPLDAPRGFRAVAAARSALKPFWRAL
jgi:acetoin utilization deacetylase AcuC-like enzyme